MRFVPTKFYNDIVFIQENWRDILETRGLQKILDQIITLSVSEKLGN